MRHASLLVLLLGAGCTLATFQQLRKPEPAAAPEAVSFPEAERMIPNASMQWQPSGKLERAYVLDTQWQNSPDDSQRAVGLTMFYSRQGGALVKDEKGSPGEVCFRYDCTLAQPFIAGGLGNPSIECNEAMARKVTCDSVDALPPGVPM